MALLLRCLENKLTVVKTAAVCLFFAESGILPVRIRSHVHRSGANLGFEIVRDDTLAFLFNVLYILRTDVCVEEPRCYCHQGGRSGRQCFRCCRGWRRLGCGVHAPRCVNLNSGSYSSHSVVDVLSRSHETFVTSHAFTIKEGSSF